MTLPDEFDPDDNFAQAFGTDADIDEEAALEALAQAEAAGTPASPATTATAADSVR